MYNFKKRTIHSSRSTNGGAISIRRTRRSIGDTVEFVMGQIAIYAVVVITIVGGIDLIRGSAILQSREDMHSKVHPTEMEINANNDPEPPVIEELPMVIEDTEIDMKRWEKVLTQSFEVDSAVSFSDFDEEIMSMETLVDEAEAEIENEVEEEDIDPLMGSEIVEEYEIIKPPTDIHVAINGQTYALSLDGSDIQVGDYTLKHYDLPDIYYPGLDYSYFMPCTDYRLYTNKASEAYYVVNSERAYIGDYGLRRYAVSNEDLTVDGVDDYIVGLGTYYKAKGRAGLRYLVVTADGAYTIITGDEKADCDTDVYNMFGWHGTKEDPVAGIIEYIVDMQTLDKRIMTAGTVAGIRKDMPIFGSQILYIYGIE